MPDDFHSDGASLPRPLRWFITRFYGEGIMEVIDDAGYLHDMLMYLNPESIKANRKVFVGHMENNGVPKHLAKILGAGLKVYDLSPTFLKKLFRKTI